MQYETSNLDEAAYLALQGLPFEITRIAHASATFSFTVHEQFEEIRARFWQGEVTVQLCRWMATRTALKNSVAKRPIAEQSKPMKSVASPSIVPTQKEPPIEVRPGVPYWYWEGSDVRQANFGNRSPHIDRIKQGNFYSSSADASNKRNPVPTDALCRSAASAAASKVSQV